MDAAPDRLRTDVDLSDAGLRGIERAIGKIGAEHQKRVAGFHGVIAGGEADQAGHADVIRVLPFDMVLAAHGVNDRRLHRFGELHELGVRARAAAAAKKRDALSQVDELRQLAERLVRWRDYRVGRRQSGQLRRGRRNGGFQRHVAGNDDDADATLQDRPAHRDLEHTRHLLGTRHELAIARALLEEALGMRLLEIVRTDLGRGDLRRDRHHRHARALAVEKTVDEVQIAGAAAAGAYGEAAGDMGVGASGEGGDLLVAHMQPFDAAAPANGVGEAIEAVADNAIDPLHSGGGENLDHLVGDGSGHRVLLGSASGSATIDETGRRRIGGAAPQRGSVARANAVADGLRIRERCALRDLRQGAPLMNGAELIGFRARERGRAANLRRAGRRKSRRGRSAAPLDDRACADASRAGGGFHGGDAWAAHRQARGLHHDARPRRAQPHHRRGLRAARRHADGDDHRAEGHFEPQTGGLSGRRHRLDDDAPDQDGRSDRERRDHSDHGAGGVPRRAAGAAGPGSSRIAGRHRPCGGARHVADPVPSDRFANRVRRRARSGG